MVSAASVVRYFWAVATVVSGLLGILVRDGRFFAAAAAFGTMWWAWDILRAHFSGPPTETSAKLVDYGAGLESASDLRPDLDDTIRLLENRLRERASRRVEIQAAIRLEEIYRVVKKEPQRAREVLELVRSRYPDASELHGR